MADFILFLFEKKLSLPCIQGYRSMLSAVFRWKVPEIASSPVIRDLLRSFTVQRPVSGISPPCWDLTKVLGTLRGAPFEPLVEATFRDLTKKTLFLVSLVTARRVGELQALSAKVTRVGGDMSLAYLPGFVAKTESASNPLPRSFLLKSLRDFVGNLEEEYLLCPVRALKFYLDRTKDLSPRPPNLFVSPRCRNHPLSKNALSFFLRETISGAGAAGAEEGPSPRAHSIRGVSTSLAFVKNWSVRDVLKAATWRSNNFFASFYLKDVMYIWDSSYSLGPYVAAGQVLHSSFQS